MHISEKVKQLPSGKWAVVHCDTGKPIASTPEGGFDTKAQAMKQHVAIMSRRGKKEAASIFMSLEAIAAGASPEEVVEEMLGG